MDVLPDQNTNDFMIVLFTFMFIATVIGTLQKGYVTAHEATNRTPDQEANNWISGISAMCFVFALVFYARVSEQNRSAPFFIMFFSTVLFQYSVTDSTKFDSPWLILGLAVVVTMLLILSMKLSNYTVITFVLIGTLFSSVATIVERKIISSQPGTGFWEWCWVFSQLVYMAVSFYALLNLGDTCYHKLSYGALFLCAASIAIVPVYPSVGKSALQLWVGEDAINNTSLLVYINTILTWAVTFIMIVNCNAVKQKEKILTSLKDRIDSIKTRLKKKRTS